MWIAHGDQWTHHWPFGQPAGHLLRSGNNNGNTINWIICIFNKNDQVAAEVRVACDTRCGSINMSWPIWNHFMILNAKTNIKTMLKRISGFNVKGCSHTPSSIPPIQQSFDHSIICSVIHIHNYACVCVYDCVCSIFSTYCEGLLVAIGLQMWMCMYLIGCDRCIDDYTSVHILMSRKSVWKK